MARLIYRGYSRLDDICGETSSAAVRRSRRWIRIERRICRLRRKPVIWPGLRTSVSRRLREIVEEFARLTTEFQAHREAIDRGLVEASRVDRLVSDLERRLLAVEAPQVALDRLSARHVRRAAE
jgi:hypothetical protein